MEEQKQDAKQESSSALAQAIASSPEALEEQQPQGTQEAGTAQQPESQEQIEQPEVKEGIPFHKHPRFQELIEENRWLKQNMEKMLQSQQQPQQQPQQPTQDPYAGMTPEEERFWRAVDQRAEKIVEQKVRQISPVIDAGRMEVAQIKAQQFRANHPDIKQGSAEELAISERIALGYSSEDAYWAVVGPKGIQRAEEQGKQFVKQKIEAKRQANVEQKSMPANAGLPPASEKLSLRQRLEKNLNLIEEGKL